MPSALGVRTCEVRVTQPQTQVGGRHVRARSGLLVGQVEVALVLVFVLCVVWSPHGLSPHLPLTLFQTPGAGARLLMSEARGASASPRELVTPARRAPLNRLAVRALGLSEIRTRAQGRTREAVRAWPLSSPQASPGPPKRDVPVASRCARFPSYVLSPEV